MVKTTVKQAVSTDGARIIYSSCLVDKIIVLNNGEVVEQRIDQELQALNIGLHHNLSEVQFERQINKFITLLSQSIQFVGLLWFHALTLPDYSLN